jgi:UDP-N-acetylmuramoyl-tripeptide--D-alanyl-D-alanine ligase
VPGPVEVDSRAVGADGLFVALPGTRHDGHDFAGAALAAGAVAVLGTRRVAGPCLVVPDAITALGALARAVLDRLPDLVVIGITGSSGKTSTKDLVAQLLADAGPTVAATASLNNELGVPLTALRAGPDTRYLVLELGARGPGQIRYLCRIAPPRIGVVVNVGVAHIGEFGSVEAITAAKRELVEALPPDGLAVLNADDPRVAGMAGRTAARVVLAGTATGAQVRAERVRLDPAGRPRFTLVTPGGRAEVSLPLFGPHQVGNALLAAAVADSCGLAPGQIADRLAEVRLRSSRRMDVFDRADGVTVIDDSYNANPASTAAALQALTAIGAGRRRIAVLGYLAELGEQERAGHEEVGRLAAELGVQMLVCVSPEAAGIRAGAASVAEWGGASVQVADQAAAVAWLDRELRPGDVVLVKGSRYRTWQVADALRPGGAVAARGPDPAVAERGPGGGSAARGREVPVAGGRPVGPDAGVRGSGARR